MEMKDIILHFYDSARSELVERIGHRDNALILYLGAAGAIFGVAYGKDGQPIIVLLLVPFLALGASFIVSQHHAVIGTLGRYLGCELEIGLRKIDEALPPQWDTSESQREYSKYAMEHRLWGHLLLLFTPSVLSVCLNIGLLFGSHEERFFWIIATLGTLLVLWPIRFAHQWRNRLIDDRLWHSHS